MGETFEYACLREIEEEVGLTIEPNKFIDCVLKDDYDFEMPPDYLMT